MSDLSAVTSRVHREPAMVQFYVGDRGRRSLFTCTEDMASHCRKVLEGEYDPGPIDLPRQPRILDVGANAGAFAIWAEARWPAAFIQCYEPNPETFKALQANVGAIGAVTHPVAVRATAGKAFLRFGKNNAGEASFHDLGEQREDGVEVECIAASTLPDCDVLKVDTEGCEVEILDAYNADRWETRPVSVLLEFHSEHDRKRIDDRMRGRDYSLTRGTIRSADRGVLCYVRRA